MNDHLAITPCAAPPVTLARHQQGVAWFHYEVATLSGRGSATGYAPGPEANARRVALAALNALQRAEGVRQTGIRDVQSVKAGHDLKKCNCRLCSNRRYKERKFRESAKSTAGRRAVAKSIAVDVTRVQRAKAEAAQ